MKNKNLNRVAASPDVEVLALCNIDSSAKHLGQAAERYSAARQYDDWGEANKHLKKYTNLTVYQRHTHPAGLVLH